MNATPPGWPRISAALTYQEPAKAIDWLCRAFGFEVRIRVEGADGSIEHSELVYAEGVVMVAGPRQRFPYRCSPRSLGGANTQNLLVYVDDADAHCARARDAGASIVSPPTNIDYGEAYWEDRGYEVEDLEGHHWWFVQRVRNPKV